MLSALKLLQILLLMCIWLQSFAQDKSQFIYQGFKVDDLNLNGIAKIHPNGLLELTDLSYQQIGRAFLNFPLKFEKSASDKSSSLSFSTHFVFEIVPEKSNLGGHGFAFVIAPSPNFTGALAVEYLGLFNISSNGLPSNHVFAVEFDTILTLNFGDINDNHVGIDVNNLKSNASAPVAYFSDKEKANKSFELISGEPIQGWIDYDEMKKLLNVTVAPIRSMKPETPLLSTSIDLSSVLSEFMYVGFSASTGSMSSCHYILGWTFNKSGPAQTLDVSKLPSVPPAKRKPDLRILVPLITASFLLITGFGAIYIRKKKYEELREDWEKEYGPQRLSYKDLYKATKGFKDKELLGIGGFGKVYKGVLPSSRLQVAVKKFSHDSQQGMKEFVAEIASMGRLRHRNLVPLLGYCRRKGEMLLVYEYMQNGSLDKILFQNNKSKLNWVQRYQILKGVASALLYLHEECEQVVIHRDVKAGNVMLDSELNGRLGDFGLAKFYEHDSIPQTTGVVGTIGYLAPEVSRTGRVTTSSDVFAFGILMLEVACGRRTVEPHRPPAELTLVDWVFALWKRGAILETSDRRLKGKYMKEEMELVLKLGLFCAHPRPAVRPTMRQVMQYLDRKAELVNIPLDSPSTRSKIADQEAAEDWLLSSPLSNEYCSLSITPSVLSCGR